VRKRYKAHVRFSDIDSFGHMHNAAYFHLFESARIQCFQEMLGPDWEWNQEGVGLVENNAQYLIPVSLSDQVSVSLHVTKIGNKSFTIAYQVWMQEKEHCRGHSTLVCYNHSTQKSIAIPEKLKTVLNQLT